MSSLMHKINVISRCQNMYKNTNSNNDFQGVYHPYVYVLSDGGGISQDKIARRVCRNKSIVARHMAHLEEHGYIERRQSPDDKRELLVYPTEKLFEISGEVMAIAKQWRGLLLEDFDEDEINMLDSVLEKLALRARNIIYDSEAKK